MLGITLIMGEAPLVAQEHLGEHAGFPAAAAHLHERAIRCFVDGAQSVNSFALIAAEWRWSREHRLE